MSATADFLAGAARMIGQGASAAGAELRTNPRARMGFALIGLIIVVAIGLRLADHVQLRQGEIATLRSSEREYLALTSKSQAEAWAKADDRVTSLLTQARARLWSDGPVGAAHADFYNWLEQTALASGLSGAQLRLGEARRIGAEGQLTELRATVFVPQAPTPPTQEAVYAFLRALSDEKRLVHARSLRVRFEPAILLEGEFVAYVTSESPNGTPRAAAARNGLGAQTQGAAAYGPPDALPRQGNEKGLQ